MNKLSFGLFVVAMCLGWTAQAADQPSHAGHGASPLSEQEREQKWQESLAKPSLAITATFDEKGRLWRVVVQDRYILVSH